MATLQKLRNPSFLEYLSLFSTRNNTTSSKSHFYVKGSPHILQILRFCRTERALNPKNGGNLCELKWKSSLVREAQSALLEYFHSTRSLQFSDAENMSMNTPEFFDRLLKKVDIDDADVGRSLARFLMYHPVNEFEPFFEVIGLRHSEYASFLPRNLMFLSDDHLLLQNYYVLCNYGVARNRVGKIYKEAREVFGYENGVLQLKLQSLENLGIEQSLVAKIVASSPYVLKGGVGKDICEFLEKLKHAMIEHDWLEAHISERDTYDWKRMLELMCLFGELGLNGEKLGAVIRQHPDLLLARSGRVTFRLLGFLFKFGNDRNAVQSVFLQFPHMPVVKFTNNLFRCYKSLVEIKMPAQDIGKLFCLHPLLLGSCELKTVKSLLSMLNCGTNKLCEMIKDDPYVLKKWILGVRVGLKSEPNRVLKVRELKTEFLLSLGFVENSKQMERALREFRGKGVEIQQRFDCLVNLGLSRENVIAMVKISPQILNQSIDVIQKKVGFFVEELGYPVSDLVTHPALVSYTIQRVKLRLLMYKWLKGQEAVQPKLKLSTLLSCSEEIFVRSYVNSHPRGHEYWENLKKKIYPV